MTRNGCRDNSQILSVRQTPGEANGPPGFLFTPHAQDDVDRTGAREQNLDAVTSHRPSIELPRRVVV